MARSNQLSQEKRQSIITLRNEGQSVRKIAKTLNVSPNAVAKTIQRCQETGSHEDRPRTGRPRVTSAAEDEFITVTSLTNRKLTAPQIRAQMNATAVTSCDVAAPNPHSVSISTVQRRLRESRRQVAARKAPRKSKKRFVWTKKPEEPSSDQMLGEDQQGKPKLRPPPLPLLTAAASSGSRSMGHESGVRRSAPPLRRGGPVAAEEEDSGPGASGVTDRL